MLLYEFLVQTISKSLIDDDKKKSSAALKILRKHYKPGTQLYKEFRLINALAKTTVSSEHVAASILKEAKAAATSMDHDSLDREKSLLIRNINHNINDDNFYNIYRFDNDVNIQIENRKIEGNILGEEINNNIKKRIK